MILNPETQVSNCCRAVVRYIYEQNMQPGDKLPSQEGFRQELGFSHNSITPAMNLLVESGMVERKRRVGTLLLDRKAMPKGLWRIALASGMLDDTPWCRFETIVCRLIQEKIQRFGCHMRYYILNMDMAGVDPHELAHFGLLYSDIESRRVDALITPAFFSTDAYNYTENLNIPMCNVGGCKKIPTRADLDTDDLLKQAASILNEYQTRKNVIIADTKVHKDNLDALTSPFMKNVAQNEFELIHASSDNDADEVAGRLLALNEADRPDGIVVLNDIVAYKLTSILGNSNYKPVIIVQSNKQIPLFYHMPVIRMEFDVEELVDSAFDILFARMMNLKVPPEMTAVKAVRQDSDIASQVQYG